MRRFIDIALSLILMVILSPILIFLAIVIKITSQGPVLFRQKRIGYNLMPFNIYKFRTMHVNADANLARLKDSRLTKIGYIMRKLHFDEFPQLINILRGDMSFIGPRPQMLRFKNYYPNLWDQIKCLKPGITGLGSSRYARKEYRLLNSSKDPESTYLNIVLPHKLRLEIFYMQKRGLLLDLKIIFWTAKAIVLDLIASLKKRIYFIIT